MILTFSIKNTKDQKLIKEMKKTAYRKGISFSSIVVKALKEYKDGTQR